MGFPHGISVPARPGQKRSRVGPARAESGSRFPGRGHKGTVPNRSRSGIRPGQALCRAGRRIWGGGPPSMQIPCGGPRNLLENLVSVGGLRSALNDCTGMLAHSGARFSRISSSWFCPFVCSPKAAALYRISHSCKIISIITTRYWKSGNSPDFRTTLPTRKGRSCGQALPTHDSRFLHAVRERTQSFAKRRGRFTKFQAQSARVASRSHRNVPARPVQRRAIR